MASLLTSPAPAQVTVPDVGVRLPEVTLPTPGIDVRSPALDAKLDARRLQVQARARSHPDRLALDPRGELIVRDELLAEPADEAALAAVLADGFTVRRRQELPGLDVNLYVLQAPAGSSLPAALRRLRRLDPAGHYDYHHVLGEGGNAEATTVAVAPEAPPVRAGASVQVQVGLVDGGVAATHEAFAGTSVVAHGCGGPIVPSAHGTAVASLLVETLGARSSRPPGHVQLLAADVYCGDAAGGAVERVIEALAWLAHRQVPVIN
ncbi:MAG TPA: hypothetical protein VD737_00030, partial [Steroidobacteraceae bacterium]|nr:hypothetical protein [Steroidobacteraceae bacterium]